MIRMLRASLVLAIVLSVVPVPAFAQPGDDADAWHTLAAKLDAGVTLDVRLRDHRHFKATFIDARPDAMVLQRKSRIPVPVEMIPYESIATMHRVDARGLSGGQVAGIALASAGAAVATFFLILLASID
jgi:hypothetical protein